MAESVNEFKDVTLTFENTVACTMNLLTDMPGGAMAQRRAITIPVTTTRKTVTFPLDYSGLGLMNGKLVQFTVAPTGALKLFSGFIRFRRVGEYIDGTQGDIWQTQEISLAP